MIDYEKVDMNLLSLIQLLNNLDAFVSIPSLPELGGIPQLIEATDALRREVALVIEAQGTAEE